MSRIRLSMLYRRLIYSPAYRRGRMASLHEEWLTVLLRRHFGVVWD